MTALLDSDMDGGVADAFPMPDAAQLSVRTLDTAALQVTEIELRQDGFGLTEPIPYQDATMLAVQLKAIPSRLSPCHGPRTLRLAARAEIEHHSL